MQGNMTPTEILAPAVAEDACVQRSATTNPLLHSPSHHVGHGHDARICRPGDRTRDYSRISAGPSAHRYRDRPVLERP